jgi:hypothetical protein
LFLVVCGIFSRISFTRSIIVSKKIRDYSAGLNGGGTKKDYSRGLDYRSGGGRQPKPLGNGGLGSMLRQDLKPGESASVLSNPHQGHTDATLYEKGSDGQVRPVRKEHLPGEV